MSFGGFAPIGAEWGRSSSVVLPLSLLRRREGHHLPRLRDRRAHSPADWLSLALPRPYVLLMTFALVPFPFTSFLTNAALSLFLMSLSLSFHSNPLSSFVSLLWRRGKRLQSISFLFFFADKPKFIISAGRSKESRRRRTQVFIKTATCTLRQRKKTSAMALRTNDEDVLCSLQNAFTTRFHRD